MSFESSRPLRPLRLLWIATKAPLPAIDGGRLVMTLTLEALVAAGAEVTLVAPSIADAAAAGPAGVRTELIDVKPHPWWAAGISSLRSGRPLTVARHTHLAIARRVAELHGEEPFDLVHVEQPQALPGAMPLVRTGMPFVLRAQNVESAVWSHLPRGPLVSRVLRAEARRLRRFETAAVVMAHVTIALSSVDAATLAALDPASRVIVIPPPGPAVTTAAARRPPTLPGDPAFVWIGSTGWAPNHEGERWLLAEIWPAMAARLPQARLHLFGASADAVSRDGDGLHAHQPPRDSGIAFDPGSILLLPLRTPAGVRMRLLEAWARGVPVIASPAAVAGLDTADGDDVLIARSAADFATCGARLAASPDLRARLVTGGRATLARRHDPATIARATLDAYHEAIALQQRDPATTPT